MQTKKAEPIMRILLLTLLLTPMWAQAYPIASSIGWGTGYTWTEATFNESISSIGATSQTPSYSSVENENLPWSLFTSFRFHEYYGFELGYIDYGTIKFDKTLTTTTDGEFDNSALRKASISTQGFYITHVIYVPLLDNLDLQAKAGVLFGTNEYDDTEDRIVDESGELISSTSKTNSSEAISTPQFSLGLLYRYQADWQMRLQLNQIEYEHTAEKEDFSQWFTSLSFERRF